MLRPSYSELMTLINENSESADSEITSRYTIVIAVAKRARQLISGSEKLTSTGTDKAVSVAVAEMSRGKLHIKTNSAKNEPEPTKSGNISFADTENPDD